MAPPSPPACVLFVCVGNSCRSQMAEAFARSLTDGAWEIWSAGSHPIGKVQPMAIEVMGEVGLDLRPHYSKGLAEVPQRQWDYVVTMGCGDSCPTVPARRRLDWDIADPVGRPPEEGRRVRDQIRGLVDALVIAHQTGKE